MMMVLENLCVLDVKDVKGKIWGDMTEVKFRFEGIRPIITIKRMNKYITYETDVDLFYPYYVLKRLLYNIVLYLRFKKLGYPVIKCQGCSRGFAEWIIKNFYGKEIHICQHCVGWYDFRYEMVRLEKEWLLDANKKIHE